MRLSPIPIRRQSPPPRIVLKYHCAMQVATGTVVDGKVIVEGLSLPEGTLVTVVTRESEATVRLSPRGEADLLDALDEADREEGISADELFERLRRFG